MTDDFPESLVNLKVVLLCFYNELIDKVWFPKLEMIMQGISENNKIMEDTHVCFRNRLFHITRITCHSRSLTNKKCVSIKWFLAKTYLGNI